MPCRIWAMPSVPVPIGKRPALENHRASGPVREALLRGEREQRLGPLLDRLPVAHELRQGASEEKSEGHAARVSELPCPGQRRLGPRPPLLGVAEGEEDPRQIARARDERVEDVDERPERCRSGS